MRDRMQTLYGAMFLALILIGIAGLSWSTFRDGGWLDQAMGSIWDKGLRNPLLFLPIIGGGLFAAHVFLRGGLTPGKGSVFGQTWVCLLVVSGVYFAYRWFLA